MAAKRSGHMRAEVVSDKERSVDPRLRELDARFGAAHGRYGALKAACEGRVVGWRWAREGCFSPYPYWFERERFERGEVLAREPSDKAQHYAYGLDAQGRVVVERQHIADGGRFYETFYEHSPDDGGVLTEGARYHHDGSGRPINVELFEHDPESGELLVAERRAQYGCSRERYRRREGRIEGVDVDYSEVVGGEVTPLLPYQRVDVDYDDLGRVMEIRKVWLNGGAACAQDTASAAKVVYKRPQTPLGYAALCRLVEERLLEAIPRAVARAEVAKTAYCLVLAYDASCADAALPPLLGVGLVEERDELLASREEPLTELLWSPAEFGLFDDEALALDDDTAAGRDLESACEALAAEMTRRGRASELPRLLCRVAWELAGRDWGALMPVSDDFVVYATDLELADLGRNMRASLFPERLRELRRRGWLPLEPRR